MRVLKTNRSVWILAGDQCLRVEREEFDAQSEESITSFLNSLDDEMEAPRYFGATVAVTGQCDLRCPYCYQNDLASDDTLRRSFGGVITEETAARAARFIRARMRQADLHSLELILFGGEPLLHPEAAAAVLKAVADCSLASATAITNGTHMTPDVMRHLCDLGLKRVQISMDGGPATHDLTRHNAEGRGSYARILRNIEDCASLDGLSYVFHINVTASNLDDIPTALNDIATACDPTGAYIGFSRIMDTGKYWHTVGQSDDMAQRFADLYRNAMDLGFQISQPSNLAPCGLCGEPRSPYGCAIGPDGSLYSCMESIGRAALKVGNVTNGYDDDGTVLPRWKHCGFSSQSPTTLPFHDQLDGMVLDELRDRGLLGKPRPDFLELTH